MSTEQITGGIWALPDTYRTVIFVWAPTADPYTTSPEIAYYNDREFRGAEAASCYERTMGNTSTDLVWLGGTNRVMSNALHRSWDRSSIVQVLARLRKRGLPATDAPGGPARVKAGQMWLLRDTFGGPHVVLATQAENHLAGSRLIVESSDEDGRVRMDVYQTGDDGGTDMRRITQGVDNVLVSENVAPPEDLPPFRETATTFCAAPDLGSAGACGAGGAADRTERASQAQRERAPERQASAGAGGDPAGPPGC